MVDIPDVICNGVFDKEFRRGRVIKTLFRCHDGKERFKFLVILNKDPVRDPTLYFLTTSQLDFYNKYPNYNKDIIRVTKGDLVFFPNETIIDCRHVYKSSREMFKKNFRNKTLRFEGDLPLKFMQDINRIVEQSFFIPKADKDIILKDGIKSV